MKLTLSKSTVIIKIAKKINTNSLILGALKQLKAIAISWMLFNLYIELPLFH